MAGGLVLVTVLTAAGQDADQLTWIARAGLGGALLLGVVGWVSTLLNPNSVVHGNRP